MAIELNHTIVPARDPKASARFLADVLGVKVGTSVSHFTPVTLDNHVTLDYDHADEVVPHHYAFAVSGAELAVVTGKTYSLYFKDAGLEAAVREVFGKPLRIKVTVGDAAPPAAIQLAPSAAEDQVTSRALAHPEVQRFQEVFGGEVRKVRNLKES